MCLLWAWGGDYRPFSGLKNNIFGMLSSSWGWLKCWRSGTLTDSSLQTDVKGRIVRVQRILCAVNRFTGVTEKPGLGHLCTQLHCFRQNSAPSICTDEARSKIGMEAIIISNLGWDHRGRREAATPLFAGRLEEKVSGRPAEAAL